MAPHGDLIDTLSVRPKIAAWRVRPLMLRFRWVSIISFFKPIYFQRITSRCTLSLALLKVIEPSCTVACNCMLRSANLANA